MSEAIIDCPEINCSAYGEHFQDAPASESVLGTSTVTNNPTKKGVKRFVMTVTEMEFVIRTMTALKVSKSRGAVLDKLSEQVASTAASRIVPDDMIVQQQNEFSIMWSRSYISQITEAHVRNLYTSLPQMAKDVEIKGEVDDDRVPIPTSREGGQVADARYALDLAILE